MYTKLDIPGAEDPRGSSIDKLWDISQHLKIPHPSWSGMMRGIYKDHAKQYKVIPTVTFDQPLWWKALSIILSEPEGSDI